MKLIETNAYPKPITKHSTEPFDMKIYAKSVPNQPEVIDATLQLLQSATATTTTTALLRVGCSRMTESQIVVDSVCDS